MTDNHTNMTATIQWYLDFEEACVVRNGGKAKHCDAKRIAGLQAVLAHLKQTQWRPIEEAPKHRDAIFDVWLGDASEADVEFYCTPGTRRSCGWHWLDGKFRPCVGGLHMPVFVVPTHFTPLPPSPETPR